MPAEVQRLTIKLSVDTSHLPSLMQTLSVLLRDQSSLSIGYTVVAFNAICPDQLGLLHQHYRRLCRILVDADEWGQIHLLDLLGRYARSMLGKPFETEPLGVRGCLETLGVR